MRAILRMWRYPRMIVLTAVIAGIYAAAQVALSPINIPLLPGVPFKTADVLTMLLGIVGGPAGAIGVGFGNAIGDFLTGGLGVGSGFGFLSSVSVGFVGYTFWWFFKDRLQRPVAKLAFYLFTGVVSAAVSASILGWGLQLLGIAPFRTVSTILIINFTAGNWIGYALYLALHERLEAMGLTWTELMDRDGTSKPHRPELGALLMTIGGIGGIIAAFLVQPGTVLPATSLFMLLIAGGAFLL